MDLEENSTSPPENGKNEQEEQNISVLSDLLSAMGVKRKIPQWERPPENDSPPASEHAIMRMEPLFPEEPKPVNQKMGWFFMAAVLLVAAFLCIFRLYSRYSGPNPPSSDVVAEFNGTYVTTSQLREFIAEEKVKEREHAYCPTHGYDHSKCDATEECEAHPVDSVEGFREMVNRYAVEQIVLAWAEKEGLSQRQDVQHGMEDLLNDSTVERYAQNLFSENVSPESISKWDVQSYYSENQKEFPGKTLAEAEDDIRSILAVQKSETFWSDYIEQLKKTSGLQVNFDVLKYEEPTEAEIAQYYQRNQESFRTEEGIPPLDKVAEKIRAELSLEKQNAAYTLRKGDLLFSIHSRRYTLGEFYQEFQEISETYQNRFSTFEAKKQLVEQMIAQELLLEESSDGASGEEEHSVEELRIQYLWQVMHKEKVDDALEEPSEEEIQKFYSENPEMVTTPASVEINMIWVSQGSNGENREQALKKAKDALAAISGGVTFSDAAKTYSEDDSAKDGGILSGRLYQDHLPAQLAETAFSLKVGEISDVIDYHGGYYILQIRNRYEAELLPLDDVRDTIKSHLSEQAHAQLLEQLEQKMLDEANFVVYEKTLRAMANAKEV